MHSIKYIFFSPMIMRKWTRHHNILESSPFIYPLLHLSGFFSCRKNLIKNGGSVVGQGKCQKKIVVKSLLFFGDKVYIKFKETLFNQLNVQNCNLSILR